LRIELKKPVKGGDISIVVGRENPGTFQRIAKKMSPTLKFRESKAGHVEQFNLRKDYKQSLGGRVRILTGVAGSFGGFTGRTNKKREKN